MIIQDYKQAKTSDPTVSAFSTNLNLLNLKDIIYPHEETSDQNQITTTVLNTTPIVLGVFFENTEEELSIKNEMYILDGHHRFQYIIENSINEDLDAILINIEKVNIDCFNSELLVEKKIISRVTGENFPCVSTLGQKELFVIERALVEYLGIKGFGVHLIAYVKTGKNKIKVWVPLRAANKKVEPNKLDNTVAGGIKAGENIYHALKREANEEAGISSVALKDAKLVGTLNYNWKKSKYSVRRDTLFLFELEVDESFYPICKDGEVENFVLMDWKKVLKLIQETDKFKINCALVTAKFFIRHGLLTDRNENNYEEIQRF